MADDGVGDALVLAQGTKYGAARKVCPQQFFHCCAVIPTAVPTCHRLGLLPA